MKCLYCEKTLTGRQTKYCSIHCKSKYQSVKPDGSRPDDYRPKLEYCECCGKKLTGRQRQFCSKLCKAKVSNYPSQKRRTRKKKYDAIKQLGGACQHCGYDTNFAVLSFHHKDETTKSFGLDSTSLRYYNIEMIAEEVEKCELLCSNCHMEAHYPHLAKTELDATLANLKQLTTHEQIKGHCVICEQALSARKTKFCSVKCRNAYHQSYENQQLRGIERKLKLVEAQGGQCESCGYDDNLAGLSFHHEGGKDYQLDLRNLANRSWKAIASEAEKCVLLCGNCHAEAHHPELMMTEITKTHA